MGKNFIKSSIGPTLKKYLSLNTNLKKLNLELNELRGEGVNVLFEGLLNESCSLEELNLKGNAIGNNGIHMIYETIQSSPPIDKLKLLDLSCN
jgi:Ran GTPase-activating protein (RanGAP) involved in mRNA processing and transport